MLLYHSLTPTTFQNLIDLIGALVNEILSGRSGYFWDFNSIDIPITQFSLKIHSKNTLRDPDRPECIAFTKTPIRSIPL